MSKYMRRFTVHFEKAFTILSTRHDLDYTVRPHGSVVARFKVER
jgi:hypothetical protein